MSGLVQLLSPAKAKEVITGEIIKRQVDGTYKVKVGRGILAMPSLIAGGIKKSSQVIIARTDEGLFIINKEQIKDRKKLEVIIDG